MALTGNMIATALGGNPSIVNYVMFTAVFSMLSLIYLIPASVSEGFAIHGMLPVIADGLNVLFTFVAGVALAAELGVNNCANSVRRLPNLVE
jgi:Membrane-associating domain